MKEIERHNKAKAAIENNFRGLSYAHFILMIHFINRVVLCSRLVAGVKVVVVLRDGKQNG